MSKKTIYQCEICYDWVSKDDINKFKRIRWTWRSGWIKTKYDICDRCLCCIKHEMVKKRIKESGGIDGN